MTPTKRLIELLKQDKVIPVVGAGFSYAVANLPGWQGAIEHGLNYANERQLAPASQIADAQSLLNNGQLVEGAAIMKKMLNAPGSPFPGWLEDLFGNPVIVSDELIHSVNDLCTDYILTTNYDRLLYSQSKLKTKQVFNWSNHEETAKALAKKEEFILHLHGVYDKPTSIILSKDDYTNLGVQQGYKAILQKLWTEYHFLFIGCSRDGVMDEDFSTVINFLQQWFPSVNHTHYILFHENEFVKGTHVELLTQCNIQAISYGNDHKNLPAFINHINPNRDKLILKTEKIKQELEATIKRLLIQPDGAFTNNLDTVESTLKTTMPSKHYWIDSMQLEVLMKVLKDYNENSKSKRERFMNYQLVMKALVSVNELNEKVEIWKKSRDDARTLNNSSFINLAILAYECLNKLPADLAEEIKHRKRYAIHSYYFDGYLGTFVNQIKRAQKTGETERYNDNPYLFENLKRIIDSLYDVLNLNPEQIFPELKEAELTFGLTTPFLVLVGSKSIRITAPEIPYPNIAVLYADTSLEFDGAEVVLYQGNYLVLTYNRQHCMRWNPEKNLAPEIFYRAAPGNVIWSLLVIECADNSITLLVNESNQLTTINDFEIKKKVPLAIQLMDYTYFNENNRLIGVKNLADNIQDAIMYDVLENGTCNSLFTKTDLWNLVREIPEVQEHLKLDLETLEEDNESEIFGYPFARNIKLTTDRWDGKQIGILNFELSFMTSGHTVLIGLDISSVNPKLLFKVLLNNKSCIASTLLQTATQTDLLCGYLSIGNITNMLEYIPAIQNRELVISADQFTTLPRFEEDCSDIYQVLAVNEHRAFVLQNGKFMYDLQLPGLSYNMQPVEDVKRIIAVGEF